MKRTILTLLVLAITSLSTAAMAQEAGEVGTAPQLPVGTTPVKVDETPKPAVEKPKTTADLRKRVTFLLSGYEFFPTRDDLDKTGSPADVIAVLEDIVRDADAKAMHRLRAIDALGFYEEDAAADLLRDLTQGTEAAKVEASARHSALMQHHAITALARSQREKSVTDLEPFLAGSDLQLKLTAVVALGKHGKDAGRDRLRTLVESDSNELVQREAKKYLR